MNFGQAIEGLKEKRRVTRLGWNGKSMWLILVPADSWHTSVGPTMGPSTVVNAHRLPWIGIKTADGGLVPWIASQTDMLAEDWEINGYTL